MDSAKTCWLSKSRLDLCPVWRYSEISRPLPPEPGGFMFRRTRYQQGSVQREKRRNGPDVWVYRWYEVGSDGASKYRKAIVGTVLTLPTEVAARSEERRVGKECRS